MKQNQSIEIKRFNKSGIGVVSILVVSVGLFRPGSFPPMFGRNGHFGSIFAVGP